MSTRNKKQLRRKAPERRRIDSSIIEPRRNKSESDDGKSKHKKQKKAKNAS